MHRIVDEFDFAFYDLCCNDLVLLGLLVASVLAATACVVVGYRSASLASRALWTGAFALCVLFDRWLCCRHMSDGG